MIKAGYFPTASSLNISNPIRVGTPIDQVNYFDNSDLAAGVDLGMLGALENPQTNVGAAFASVSQPPAHRQTQQRVPHMLFSTYNPGNFHVVASSNLSEITADRQLEEATALFTVQAYEPAYNTYGVAITNYRTAIENITETHGDKDVLDIKLTRALLGRAGSLLEGVMELVAEIQEGATIDADGRSKIHGKFVETIRLCEEARVVSVQLEESPNPDHQRTSHFLQASALHLKAKTLFNMDAEMATQTSDKQLKLFEQAEALFDLHLVDFPPDYEPTDRIAPSKELADTLVLHGHVLASKGLTSEAAVAYEDALALIEKTLPTMSSEEHEGDIFDIRTTDLDASQNIVDSFLNLGDYGKAAAFAKHYREVAEWFAAFHKNKGHYPEALDHQLGFAMATELILEANIRDKMFDDQKETSKKLQSDLMNIWREIAGTEAFVKTFKKHIKQTIRDFARMGKELFHSKDNDPAIAFFTEAITLQRLQINLSQTVGLNELRERLVVLLQRRADAEKQAGYDEDAINSYLDASFTLVSLIEVASELGEASQIRKFREQHAFLLEYLVLPLLRKYGKYHKAVDICDGLITEYTELKDKEAIQRVRIYSAALTALAEEQGVSGVEKEYSPPNVRIFARRTGDAS